MTPPIMTVVKMSRKKYMRYYSMISLLDVLSATIITLKVQ